MKKFNLEQAKAGAAVQYKDGTPVRIVCFDLETPEGLMMVGIARTIIGHDIIYRFDLQGGSPSGKNLFMAPKLITKYINVYRCGSTYMHPSKEQAVHNSGDDTTLVACVKVEYEE